MAKNLASNLHQKLFFLLILLLPTQLGFHFWPEWASVFGIRVDYLSPTIYLTDLLVVGILVSWWWEKRNFKFLGLKFTHYLLLSTFYLLVTSLLVAQNQGAAIYKLLKFIEFSLLGFYVFNNWKLETRLTDGQIGDWKFRAALSAAMIYSSILAWLQFLLGHTLNGPLWWLGERTFDVSTPGVALVTIGGQEFMRPYATFPHPNALAGFLLVGVILLIAGPASPAGRPSTRVTRSCIMVLGIATLVLTFSRSAWITAGIVSAILLIAYLRVHLKALVLTITIIAILTSFAFPYFPNFTNLPNELSIRLDLARAAFDMFKEYPLTGVGLNNFIVQLPNYGGVSSVSWWLQPVHNVFLLTLAETGIIGFSFLIWLLLYAFRKLHTINYILLTAFLVILITGVFDHYWFTLQQTQLLATIVIGVLLRDAAKMSSR